MEANEEDFYVLSSTNETVTVSEPDSKDIIIPLTVLFTVIFIAGILGNISTCFVIARNRSMHTPTNFYLFTLAISDLLLLICGLPLEVYRLWFPLSYPLSEAVCIGTGMISEASANATVLTITAFTMERYIAICRPFISHTISKLSRAVRYIIVIWMIAVCTAVPQAMQFGVVSYSEQGQNISACTVIGQGVHQVFVLSSFIFFVVPMTLITVLYVLIGIKLHSSDILNHTKKSSIQSDESSRFSRYRNANSQKRVIRMLVAVALSFFICWAPFHVQRLIAIYGKNMEHLTDTFYVVYIVLTYLSGILYFLSTAINPFLYSIMSNKFRNAFKITLSRWCGKDTARLERRYRHLLASQHERAIRVQRQHNSRFSRMSTTSSQIGEPPPRAQCYNHSTAVSVHTTEICGRWRQHLIGGSHPFVLPRSISNSSLQEYDQELSSEELTTFLYQVNCDIGFT